MPEVLIRGDCGESSAYVAVPDGDVACPGVVIIHDLVGMTPDLRSQADWLAGAGYLAVAPNLFHRGWRVLCIRAALRDMTARRGKVFDKIETVRRWAAGHERCTGTVGIIGFCMGGGFALLLAPRGGFAASSVNYGHVPDDAESLLAGACPVVGSYGGKDLILRGAADRLERALTVNGVDHDVKLYPNAAHSFLNDHRNLMFRSLKIAGFAYDSPSAADARRRIVAFFDRHLKQPTRPEQTPAS